MKLIIGLGNPGKEYEGTRHNVGFVMIDYLATKNNILINKEKFGGLYGEYFKNNEKIMFLKPGKFINLSGEVISDYINYFKINIEDILIICDDLNLNVGNYKFKYKGTSGGHNGLKNIEMHLGTQNYKRLKIGISHNNLIEVKDYVLGKFNAEDYEKIQTIAHQLPLIIKDYLELPFDNVMNKYNKRQK
ncbi:MAG: aminoacyl-tRNA hydrolase [Bacilli bacterium]|nr:aminoacyl-tRNA hydrolase [Bacilli bacterium]MDD4282230.1 aminoacyl-tRNA hydrolase [Bacilli bacterium]MDD4718229.1 aminoacyl-tRNA hydrolase [Bacilli bacterium]